MKQIKLELLKKGDKVIGFYNGMIAIQKPNGEVEIFTLNTDEDGLVRLADESILITYGDKNKQKVTISNDENTIEVGTF